MSQEFSIGVEEEYQLVDPASGALQSRARDVLEIDWSDDLTPEALETTVEIGTQICDSGAELDAELRRLRTQVATAAAAQGLGFIAAGLHPFAHAPAQQPTAEPRYERIKERFGRIATDEHKFGMHIHVQVPDRIDRIAVFNRARWFLPHLLALSASSPFYEGSDTRYASYRAVLWRRWPFSGVPPRFTRMAEHDSFIERMVAEGMLIDAWTVYWSLRVHPEYPTLEFRVTDPCPRIEDASAVAALARATVAAIADGELADAASWSDSVEQEIIEANEWAASRFGLDARIVGSKGRALGMRAAVRTLVDAVAPYAAALDDAEALAGIETILERGNGADRMRRQLKELGTLEAVVGWLAGESALGIGLDRRASQRASSGA